MNILLFLTFLTLVSTVYCFGSLSFGFGGGLGLGYGRSYEYPGYGCMDGETTEESINETIECVYRFVNETLGCPCNRIFFFGRSIGTGPSVRMAAMLMRESEVNIGGLILQSPYLSILDIVKQFGFIGNVGSIFIRNRWNNQEMVGDVMCPVLFLHGKDDQLIQPFHSEQLYLLCGSEEKVLKMINGDHNNFDFENDILGNMNSFLEKILENMESISLNFDETMFTPTKAMIKMAKKAIRMNKQRTIENNKTFSRVVSIFGSVR